MVDRHHLLECILWPNGDGTYRKIINKSERLKELGIYYCYKLTIPIEHGLHQTMHREFEKGTEYERTGENNPMYGKGEKHPAWKSDKAGTGAMYQRALNLYKAGEITEEEFQPYRDKWAEHVRSRKKQSGVQSSENLMD